MATTETTLLAVGGREYAEGAHVRVRFGNQEYTGTLRRYPATVQRPVHWKLVMADWREAGPISGCDIVGPAYA